MIKLYSDEDFYSAIVQRRKIVFVYCLVAAIALAAIGVLLAYYISLPYGDNNTTWVMAVASFIMIFFVFFTFPFMGIKFMRCHKYCKKLKNMSVGLKEQSTHVFDGIDDWTTREGVDVNVARFVVRSVKRNEKSVRQIYVDGEKDYPPFYEGDTVKMITHGNFLISYEIIEQSKIRGEAFEEFPENSQKEGE